MKPEVKLIGRPGSERLVVQVDLGDRSLKLGEYRNSVEASRRAIQIRRIIDASFEAGKLDRVQRDEPADFYGTSADTDSPASERGGYSHG